MNCFLLIRYNICIKRFRLLSSERSSELRNLLNLLLLMKLDKNVFIEQSEHMDIDARNSCEINSIFCVKEYNRKNCLRFWRLEVKNSRKTWLTSSTNIFSLASLLIMWRLLRLCKKSLSLILLWEFLFMKIYFY